MPEIRPLLYANARSFIRPGDMLLYRPAWKLSNWLIAEAGKVPGAEPWQRYAHVGMADLHRGHVLLYETLQGRGARAVRLSTQVQGWPRQWDVYRLKSLAARSFCADVAIEVMIDALGQPYGWWNLARAALRHISLLRKCLPALTDDHLNGSAPTCSQLASRACRQAGRDPRPGSADIVTEPAHLADPKFASYKFSLCWTAGDVEALIKRYGHAMETTAA